LLTRRSRIESTTHFGKSAVDRDGVKDTPPSYPTSAKASEPNVAACYFFGN
jgi:hypothetical protein